LRSAAAVVCGADADHPLVCGDADIVLAASQFAGTFALGALMRLSPGSRRASVTSACLLLRLCLGERAVMRQPSLKLAPASVVVPYQYSMIAGGHVRLFVFGDVPQGATIIGAAIIIGAGFYIFLRERELGRRRASSAAGCLMVVRSLRATGRRDAPTDDGLREAIHGATKRIASSLRFSHSNDGERHRSRLVELLQFSATTRHCEKPEAIDGVEDPSARAVQLDAAPLEAAFLEDVRDDGLVTRAPASVLDIEFLEVKSIAARAASVPKPGPNVRHRASSRVPAPPADASRCDHADRREIVFDQDTCRGCRSRIRARTRRHGLE